MDSNVAMLLLGQEGEQYPGEGLKLSLVAFASQYTGHGRHVLGRTTKTVSPEAAQVQLVSHIYS